ncbi:WXG100 family type VII secretion target [Nocardia sp. NPDC059240]|uniref:WXG100 family type VII secretion target n=1 Tax=Nocardia sp. NPDC059240 TaxID=3346786 RepID=UPI0036787E08
MGTPTISQVKAWDPGTLNTQAGEWEQKAKTLGDTLDAAARSVDGSHHYWIGDAGDSMRDRHDEIHGDAKTVKKALEDGATAARNGATAIQNAKTTLLNQVKNAEDSGFTVSDTGEVKVSTGWLLILQYAGNDKTTLQASLEHRAQEYQKTIQAALTDCGTADDQAMTAVNNAFADLTTTQIQQPTTDQLDQLTADQARKDLQALKDGSKDPALLARIRLATTLSDYDKQDLGNGGTVGLAQFPYLQAFTQGMNGMSGEDITKLSNGDDQVKAAIANDFRIVSDPQVHSLDGSATGGMKQLPDTVQHVLTEDPSTLAQKPTTAGRYGNTDRYDPNSDSYKRDTKDLKAVTDLMGHGDTSIQGSDINRGMIKQAAELAGTETDSGSDRSKLANSLLENAANDHIAVHDAVRGDNMDITCTPGGHYNADSHVLEILQHPWSSDQHGAEHMFGWIGDAATKNPAGSFVNNLGGETADHLAHVLADHSGSLAKNMPNTQDLSLGAVNPALTRVLANSMVPYLGNFVTVDTANSPYLINHTARPFDTATNLSHMFEVLDSDPEAAKIVNAGGTQWNDYLTYKAGLDTQNAPALGHMAGHLENAMTAGMDNQLDDLGKKDAYQYALKYGDMSAAADSVAALTNLLPGAGPVTATLSATADTWFKDKVFTIPYDPTSAPPPDWRIESLKSHVESLIIPDDARTEYELAQGYSQHDPGVRSSFNEPDGSTLLDDWQKAQERRDHLDNDYTRFKNSVPDGQWIDQFTKNRDSRDDVINRVDGARPNGQNGPVK